MSDFGLHSASMHKGLPVTVKADFGRADVKCSGRIQNRQLMRGKGVGAAR